VCIISVTYEGTYGQADSQTDRIAIAVITRAKKNLNETLTSERKESENLAEGVHSRKQFNASIAGAVLRLGVKATTLSGSLPSLPRDKECACVIVRYVTQAYQCEYW